jgi:hypothetical protein
LEYFARNSKGFGMAFRENVFVHVLSKIKALNPKNWTKENKEFAVCRHCLIQEASAFDTEAGKAASFLFGDLFLEGTNLAAKTVFYEFISVYVEIFVNLHQYRKVTIENSMRIATSYFSDLEKIYGSSSSMIHFNKMRVMLEKIASDILRDKRYRI